nr:hypothetical protein [Tanacetum cinerariifolium]
PHHTPSPEADTSHPTTSSIPLPSLPTDPIPPAQEEEIVRKRSINEGETAAERISNDSEEIARVLTSMDAAIVLAGGIDVPTGNGSISTTDPPATIIS